MTDCTHPNGHEHMRPATPHLVEVQPSRAEPSREPIEFDSDPGYRECWHCKYCNETLFVNPKVETTD